MKETDFKTLMLLCIVYFVNDISPGMYLTGKLLLVFLLYATITLYNENVNVTVNIYIYTLKQFWFTL